jgi:tetratricopeptide (TPR) repeat protein
MSRIVALPPSEPSHKTNRQFLTQPSSWAKLGSVVALFLVLIWLNSRSATPSVAVKHEAGQVAGVQDVRTDPVSTEKPVVEEPQAAVTEEPESSEPTAAQKEVDKILGTSNYTVATLLAQGQNYLDKGDLGPAENFYKRATEISPEYRDAWYLLGFTYLKEYQKNPVSSAFSMSKGQWAVVSLTKAATIDPLSKDVKDLLAIAQKAAQ